jgi:hypothetical protein
MLQLFIAENKKRHQIIVPLFMAPAFKAKDVAGNKCCV